MASRGSKKTGTHRMDGAIAALTPLGFAKKLIRDTIRELITAYGNNDAGWYFVEENYYKLVIDKIIEEQEGRNQELEAKRQEDCEEAPVELEAGSSSSSRDLSGKAKFSPGRAPTKLEACSAKVPDVELSHISPSSVPKRRPCYGWISEDEEED